MLNLIKMDLYRLFHSRAFKIGLIASVIISFAAMLLSFGIVELVKMTAEETTATDISDMSIIFPMLAWLDGADFADIVIHGTGALSLFIGCMVSASFISSEQSCGYTKNVAGQISNKGLLILSKFIVTSLVYMAVLFVYLIMSIICTFLFFSQYITTYSIGQLVAMVCLRYLLFITINSVVVFLCTLTKSHSIAMVYGAILGIGVTSLAYLAINAILSMLKISLDISKFMPDGINNVLSISTLGSVWLKAIIVAAVFLGVFITASIMLVKKRDVK